MAAPASARPSDVVSTAAPPQEVAPMSAEGQAHYARGLELYARREYRAAAEELRRGFLVEPRREFIFAEAQAWRLAGDCQRALTLYRQFVASEPPALQVDAARLGMDRCGPERDTRPPAAITAAPVRPLIAEPQAPGPAPPPTWWRDPWAVAAIGVGAVALGTGLGFAVASNSARDQADDAAGAEAGTYAEYADLWDTARRRRSVAVSAIVGGLVMMGAGVARFVLVHRRETKAAGAASPPAAMSISVVGGDRGGGTVVWRGAF